VNPAKKQPARKPKHIEKVDEALWRRFKAAAKAQGKFLWAYHEEALKEKLQHDGY
jgi:NAD+--asparagine ADP-ribosyltransferase